MTPHHDPLSGGRHGPPQLLPRRPGGAAVLLIAVVTTVSTLVTYVLLVSGAGRAPAATVSAVVADPAVPPVAAAPTSGAAPQVRRPAMGLSVPTTDDLDRFIAATGTTPAVVDVFEDWSLDRPLQRGIADTVAARGARLSITWEPWDSTGSHTHQPDYTLASIIDGDHDAYIDGYAVSIRQYGHPVTIRLMHEMNGNWYPWGAGVNGNQPGQFVPAWQHVHDRFAALGVTNVTWMWAPNAVYQGAAPLGPLYPGDAYVDAVGISNYNWGELPHDSASTHWRTFGSLFDPSIAELRSLTSRPVWLAEGGSSNSGGSKAAWLAEMLAELRHRPEVAGLVWFDQVDARRGVDWRIETEPEAVAAWRAGFLARQRLNQNGSTPQ